MCERLFQWLGSRYILVMMIVTRVIGGSCGALVILYVNFTMPLPPGLQERFAVVASTVVLWTLALTVVQAQFETRHLRRLLRMLEKGEMGDETLCHRAGYEAVTFSGQHHFREAFVVPLNSGLPLVLFLWLVDDASLSVLIQVTIAAFMGTSVVILSTYFLSERWISPVTRRLLDKGVAIPFDKIPNSRLQVRVNVCFILTIVVTSLMISALANARATDIINNPLQQQAAVENLRQHTVYIMLAAIATGFIFSRLLSKSISSRAADMVNAMKRVQQGELSQRLVPTGNDEIDVLARQFNAMIEQLEVNDRTIRDLATNLEHKVETRTKQLSKSKKTLQRSLRKLREYDQLKTELFSNVSHELRTPLTMILSPVERMLEQAGQDLPGDFSSKLDVIRVNGHRLLDLINQLLEFSKLEAGQTTLRMGTLDINQLAENLTAAGRNLAEQRGITLVTALDPGLTPFGADVEKIDTVVSNLFSNALKFTPEGGTIRIETSLVGTEVRLAVSDTGIGIAEGDFNRVFERFVQIDGSRSRKFSGTGLGLALAKEFIELHGGRIWVESHLGRGTTFTFVLPMPPPVFLPLEAPSAQQPAVSGLKFAELMTLQDQEPVRHVLPADAPLVLVVDDTPEMRNMVAELLSDQYRIITGADGGEGHAAALREVPDLIISDVMMPNVDGYEFCRRVKSDPMLRPIPFIMLTAKADLSMKIEGLDCGADDYLVKPFSANELRARVRSLLKLRRLHRELDVRNHELQSTLDLLKETQAQLVHSEKTRSLGELVAGLAHEINNAINAVYNGIQPLRDRTQRLERLILADMPTGAEGEGPSARAEVEKAFKKITQLADVIQQGASRTARIVRDMKIYSHPGVDVALPFNLHESLDVCLNLLSSELKHRVEVVRHYGDVGEIIGPQSQLNQVFMNIFANAQQAIVGSGTITVTTRALPESVEILIRDTGSGIPPDILDRIFDPFFTTKPPGHGTGLGLSISQGLVTKLGGRITVTSQVGEGSEFRISIPQTPLSARRDLTAAPAPSPASPAVTAS